MSTLIVGLDGWELGENADRRFRRTVLSLLIPFLILAIAIPFLQLTGLQSGGGDTLEQRVVSLVPDAAPAEEIEEPAPAEDEAEKEPEKPKPVEKPKPEEKSRDVVVQPPVPTEAERKEAARKVAQRTGVMAMADQLASLRDPSMQGFDASRPLTTSIATAQTGTGATGGSSEAIIAQSAASSSGGIGDVGTSDERRSKDGLGMGQRRTAKVESPIGAGPDKTRPGQAGDKLMAGRTLEEIQLGFDRNKGAITSIFKRAERDNPNIGAGKIVITLTIEPNGSVSACSVVSSTFNDPDLERKIVQRVMLMNFGPKNVPAFTYPNYPINYLPS